MQEYTTCNKSTLGSDMKNGIFRAFLLTHNRSPRPKMGRMLYDSVVALLSFFFVGPRKHSGKIIKCEIC